MLTSTPHLTTTDHPCSQQHGPFTSSTSFAPASIASPAPSRSDVLFYLHDMTLLHHWTASTSQQVAKDKEIRNFWQNTATSVALQHLYVLQEIMSVAALHLAYLSQSEKSTYMEIASEHHIRSLQGLHTAVSQCRNDIEQGSTVFLWSLLNMFYVCLTLGRLGCSSDICIEDHRDRVLGTVWIRLIRGIKSVIEENRPAVERDNFNAIVSIGNWRSLDSNKSMGEEAEYFSRLAELWKKAMTKKVTTRLSMFCGDAILSSLNLR